MTIFRYIFILLLIVLFIHFAEVFRPDGDLPGAGITPDTSVALENLQAMQHRYFELKVQEKFWKNRIELARAPSFVLTANLQDSLITIDMQGVQIHQARISGIQISQQLYDSLYHASLLRWLGKPFNLLDQHATVAKEPIQERFISSRREAESQLIHLRDPEDSSYVSITLAFDRQLTLNLKESEGDSVFYPLFPEINKQSGNQITVYLPRLDALTIYRALPEHTSLVLNI